MSSQKDQHRIVTGMILSAPKRSQLSTWVVSYTYDLYQDIRHIVYEVETG